MSFNDEFFSEEDLKRPQDAAGSDGYGPDGGAQEGAPEPHEDTALSKRRRERERRRRDRRGMRFYTLFFPISFIFMEIVIRIRCFKTFFGTGFMFSLLFALAFGFFAAFICGLFKKRGKFTAGLIMMILITLLFGTQAVYYTIFKTFATTYLLSMAGAAITGFFKETLAGIWKTMIPLIFLFLPLIIFIIFGKKLAPDRRYSAKAAVLTLLFAVLLNLVTAAIVKTSTSGIMSYKYCYYDSFEPQLTVKRFGILKTIQLDIGSHFDKDLRNRITGKVTDDSKTDDTPDTVPEDENPADTDTQAQTHTDDKPIVPVKVYKDNVLEIDFDKLIEETDSDTIADMHEYFKNAVSTKENEYTGMFKGKNLIWIVGEGFHTCALDQKHTPTLCKLANEGFVFKNYYTPLWYGSTSTGEYVTTTGLIPKPGVLSYYRTSLIDMPFGFGNIFSKLGYSTRAYHNHDYTYYDRDVIYPNLGYDFKGIGNGLEGITDQWPESDLEMMQVTVPEFVNDEHFMVYYLSVSGHMNYSFYGNMMSYIHEDDVADLDYSEPARAYLACQMEFDLAIENLIQQLDDAGVLDDTVIVISGDHYPYGLEETEIEELLGYDVDSTYELYHSTLIIWNSAMARVEVDKYCNSIDVMPTLCNLFDLDYDSRLVMGNDILSDTPGLVVFENRSFIRQEGRYDSSTDTITSHPGYVLTEDLARETMSHISDMFEYSEKILDNDYYSTLEEYLK